MTNIDNIYKKTSRVLIQSVNKPMTWDVALAYTKNAIRYSHRKSLSERDYLDLTIKLQLLLDHFIRSINIKKRNHHEHD